MMIGEKIKALRTSLGLSQNQFGKKCGISSASICEWETGKKEPRLGLIQKIITTYKVNPSVFFATSVSICKHSKKTQLPINE